MPMRELEPVKDRVNIQELRYGSFPVGEWLVSRTLVSEDADSQQGLAQAREALTKRGLLVLDAHVANFDIVATAVGLSQAIALQALVAPASAYDLKRNVISRGFLSRLNALPHMELYPIYRDEDLKHRGRRKEYLRAVRENRLKRAQVTYLRRAVEALEQPGSAVLVAAYNGANRVGKDLAPGVERLLRRSPALLSYSAFDWGRMRMSVNFSAELLEFSQDTEARDMLARISWGHKQLIQGAGEGVASWLA